MHAPGGFDPAGLPAQQCWGGGGKISKLHLAFENHKGWGNQTVSSVLLPQSPVFFPLSTHHSHKGM